MEPTEVINPNRKELTDLVVSQVEAYHAMLRTKGLSDLFLFNKYILQAEEGSDTFSKLAPFHREICTFVDKGRQRKQLLLVPRSHLKTKLVTIGYATQRIIQDPTIRILIYSGTWQAATDIQMSIQKNLKSEFVIELFGDLSEGATEWRADRTRLAANDKRESTITAAGIDNNLVGGHYDLIIMDDVVTRDNVNTSDQIQKVITKYKDSLDLLEPHGQLVVIGTRWHDMDLYGWILNPDNNVLDSFDVVVKQAYEGNLISGEDFEPLWPGKFGRDGFRKLLREQGWYHFSSQYMNNPVPEDDAQFKREFFRYWDSDIIKGKTLNKFLAVDPALSTSKESDFTAMVVVGIDEYGHWYILDIVRRRLSPNDIINEIFRLKERWNLTDIGIEMVAFQKTLAYSLKEDIRYKRKPFHITELKPNERAKDQRIKGLQPLYENGQIWHEKVHPNTIYLEDELVRFPRSTHDDVIDALAYILDFIYAAKPVGKQRAARRYLY